MSSPLEREEAVFHEAVKILEPTRRKLFLDEVCAGDPELRVGVERLLAANEVAGGFFGEGGSALKWTGGDLRAVPGLTESGGPGRSAVADEKPGTRIGRFKLLERIGEGGCGVVYMAEQEEPVRRRVALKIIKLGMDTRSVIARFEAERQALAMMDHPNIAKVFDAGATETGRPFFVMELVRGVKITEYCDQNQLDTRQRLDLFIQICHAIQHAHQKGIVHRDIKPSNILVTLHDGVPVPKVIDFGIAKATERPLTDRTLFTPYSQFIGTPAYMSPEQAEMSGLDVDTRSDIYSLGVLLYELLTGRTPFDARQLLQSGLDEMRRTLREKEPPPPSRMLTTLQRAEQSMAAKQRQSEPPKLISLLRGDLDWMAMKALEKDRRRRYETANGFAMDIQRFLDNEPIIARPPSRLYRFQKLVHRNKVLCASGTAVALALIVGLGASTWLFLQERASRQRAVAAEREQSLLRQEAERTSAQERALRRQAEIRERITQAASLLNQNQPEAADGIMSDLPQIPASPESAAVLRRLGDWHAVHGRWQLAAQRLTTLMEANRYDSAEIASVDALNCGGALLETGEVEAYQKFRREIVERFSGTPGSLGAPKLIKACLLWPADPATLQQFEPLAEAVVPGLQAMLQPHSVPDSAARVANELQAQTVFDLPPDLTVEARAASDLAGGLRTRAFGDAAAQPGSFVRHGDVAEIVAGGSDVWLRGDHFLFLHRPVTNDFDWRLRVHSVLDTDGSGFARAGLMVRDTSIDPSGRMILIARNAGPNAGNPNPDSFQVTARLVDGNPAQTTSRPSNPLPPAFGSNSWVRLRRSENMFACYISSNGLDWSRFFLCDAPNEGDRGFTNQVLDVGIAVCAHSPDRTTTAVVSDLSITPRAPARMAARPPSEALWLQGWPASLRIAVAGDALQFQWRKNGVDVPGETNAVFRVAVARSEDAAVYSLFVSNNCSCVLSPDIKVSVVKDTDPPLIDNAVSLDGLSLGINFSKLVDPTLATNLNNYRVDHARATNATLMPGGCGVVLEMKQPVANGFLLGVSNVVDRSGNVIPADTRVVGTVMKLRTAVLGDAAMQPVAVSYAGQCVTITAGGSDIGQSGDHGVFQYFMVTNDFDYRLRVVSLTGGGGGFARAGLMARDSVTNNACHQVMVAFNASNIFQVIVRTRGGTGQTYSQPPNPLPVAFGSNSWVRLQRVGTIFYTYASDDGFNWEQLHQFDSAALSDGPFANPICLGIATSAWSRRQTATAVLSDLGQTPNISPGTIASLALLEYRRQNFARAAQWCERCLGGDYEAAQVALARVLHSLCLNRLDRAVESRSELRQADEMIGTQFSTGLGGGSPVQGSWSDWVAARLLLREAEPAIELAPDKVE